MVQQKVKLSDVTGFPKENPSYRHQGQAGKGAEKFFLSLMEDRGIPCRFVDSWYDFLVDGSIRVEVKSCQPSVAYKNNGVRSTRPGYFDFTDIENRRRIWADNTWVACILHHEEQYMFLGFMEGKMTKMRRTIPFHKLRALGVRTLDEWVLEARLKEVQDNGR